MGRYVKQGSHGGSRHGAGRRSLSKVERLLIGAIAEQMFQTLEPLLDPRLPFDEIAQSQNALADVPIAERNQLPDDAKEHRDWLTETLHRHRVQRGARRKLSDIFTSLAKEATEKTGIAISARQVRRWRDQYLATKK